MNTVAGAVIPRRASFGRSLEKRGLALGAAGIAGPLLFTIAFLVQEALRRGEYSPIAEPISALEAGPNGWVQQVNFVVFGILTFAFVAGLRRALPATRVRAVGSAMLFLSGLGLVLAAVFPLREDATGATYDPGGHIIAGVMFFMTSAAGLTILSRALARDSAWRDLAGYTLLAGIVAMVGFITGRPLVMRDGAPLHDFAGLYQRILVLAVIFPCRIVLSLRLLKLARGDRTTG